MSTIQYRGTNVEPVLLLECYNSTRRYVYRVVAKIRKQDAREGDVVEKLKLID